MTATDPGAIPEPLRKHLEVIELPGYTEQEKLAIAEQYLLKRPFDESGGTPAGCLAPEPAAPPLTAAPDAAPDAPMVLLDQDLSSFWERALSNDEHAPAGKLLAADDLHALPAPRMESVVDRRVGTLVSGSMVLAGDARAGSRHRGRRSPPREWPRARSCRPAGRRSCVADEPQHGHGAHAEPSGRLLQRQFPTFRHLAGTIDRHAMPAGGRNAPAPRSRHCPVRFACRRSAAVQARDGRPEQPPGRHAPCNLCTRNRTASIAERGATEQPKSGASEEQEWIPPGTRPALTRSGSW